MKQILHIYAKDVRRFLPEILIVLSLVTAYVSINCYLSATDPQFRSGSIETGGKLAKLLPLLIALTHFAWILLVCRVIQAERLVGDTQLWITRPYEWKKLIAEKLLFVGTFVYLPVLAGFFILRAASGPPLHSEVATGFLGGSRRCSFLYYCPSTIGRRYCHSHFKYCPHDGWHSLRVYKHNRPELDTSRNETR